jgi:hypothetical protein
VPLGVLRFAGPIANHVGDTKVSTQFQKAIEKVLKGHNKLEWFHSGIDFYLRLDQSNCDRAPRKVLP